MRKRICLIVFSILLSGCSQVGNVQQLIVNSHAVAFLTKNNELQFRFKINQEILNIGEIYKVKVSINNDKLASALGTNEIIYGANEIYDGEYIEVKNSKDQMILMEPIPLMEDLHVFDIEKMIVEGAVSVEVFNDEKVIAKALLTNFASPF